VGVSGGRACRLSKQTPAVPVVCPGRSRSAAIRQLQFGTVRAVAEYLRVSWDLVKDIHKTWLAARYRTIDLSGVRYLDIDEFSLRKRHSYMTIFVDLQTGRILHAVEGTSKEAISPFLRTLAKKAKKIKAVSMDMSTSCTSAVKEHLPGTPIVFDRYHVMALINRQIDTLRREQQHRLDVEGTKTLKGSRFLLLRNCHELSDSKRNSLDIVLTANQPFFSMHAMKEQFRLSWSQGTGQSKPSRFFSTGPSMH
jgi:transposase